jgi:hypothetical protein
MEVTKGKLLSLVIAAGYAVAMIFQARGVSAEVVKGCIVLLLPLALISFPDELGRFTGYVGRGGNIDTETPAVLVAFMGWFFLAGLPVLLYLLS